MWGSTMTPAPTRPGEDESAMEPPLKLYTKESGSGWVAWLALLSCVALAGAFAMVFFYAPVERVMGIVQKIFYFHVPSAMAAYAGFTLCCGASVVYLVNGRSSADVWARAGAEVGVVFCAAVLISGPLWARKAWGTYWTGEPRLLLTLVLWLIFVAYLVIREVGGRAEMTRKICAVLAILGFADIPLVKYSVDRWRGNHPQVVTGEGGGLGAPEMGHAFAACSIAVLIVFVAIVVMRVRTGLVEEDIETWHRSLHSRRMRFEDVQARRAEKAEG